MALLHAVIGALSALALSPEPAGHADLILRGGTVVDGTGAPGRRADVAITGGRIAAVGDLGPLSAAREIDVAGLVVAPGFIDMHSHADLILLGDRAVQERLLAAKIAQGVTTVIVGNCGLGAAPATTETQRILAGVNGWMSPAGLSAPPGTIGDYLDRLEAHGVALNAGTLVPHGPLRLSTLGPVDGAPTPAQLQSMVREVRAGLEQGAFGLSVGLIYPPGMYSATDELVELARPVARAGRLFTAHVRGSSDTLLAATGELIDIGRRSGARVHHSHLEAVGRRFWTEIPAVLVLEDRARAEGLDVSHDVFPYTRAATMMSAIFPPWALEGGVDGLLARLADPASRERLRVELSSPAPAGPPRPGERWPHNLVGAVGWDGIIVASVGTAGPSPFAGRRLSEIAAAEHREPFDVVADLMLAEHGRVGQLVDEISGRDQSIEPLLAILSHPAADVVSDAEDYGRGVPHPAHAGAFARALRLAREHGILSLESVVRRMTGRPAELLGLEDRGRLRPGAAADLVAFDPRRVADRADWRRPRRRAEGLRWVLIGGAVVVEHGRYVGGLHGAVLRAAPDQRAAAGGLADSISRGRCRRASGLSGSSASARSNEARAASLSPASR